MIMEEDRRSRIYVGWIQPKCINFSGTIHNDVACVFHTQKRKITSFLKYRVPKIIANAVHQRKTRICIARACMRVENMPYMCTYIVFFLMTRFSNTVDGATTAEGFFSSLLEYDVV